MANTLKFGSGQWATKVGSTLAYNDEGGNFKPLPFNFTRSTGGTRVNKDGLIEMVTNNKPRIDFTDANGALLLEPQRTNSLLQSNQFDTTWTIPSAGAILDDNQSGIYNTTDAWKLIQNTNTGYHYIQQSVNLTGDYVYSIYVKKGEYNGLTLFLPSPISSINALSSFNLLTGSFTTNNHQATSLNIGNDWYRLSAKTKLIGSHGISLYVNQTIQQSETGDGTSGIYIQSAQLELGSYATSYIPTQGATATRVVDACSQTPPSGIIGQTEGTMFLYADIQKFNDSSFYIGISNGLSLASAIYMVQPSSGTLQIQKRNAGVDTVLNITTGNWSAGFNKVAIVYTTTSLKVFINGVQKGSISFSGLPPFTRFSLGSRPDQVGGLVPKTEYKQQKLYNTALTDQELINLTTI